MSEIRRMMSSEERAEYDDLLYDATHYEDGEKRPSKDRGHRLHDLLVDAEKAERPWATWVREAGEVRGLSGLAGEFLKLQEVIQTPIGERVVTKSAVMGVKRIAKGHVEDQQVLWEEMTRDDLQHVIQLAAKHATAARDRIAIGRMLLGLLDETGMNSVPLALESIGKTFDEFLIGDLAA